jgi:hypothetical protein
VVSLSLDEEVPFRVLDLEIGTMGVAESSDPEVMGWGVWTMGTG